MQLILELVAPDGVKGCRGINQNFKNCKEIFYDYNERAFRVRRALWSPNKKMESKDEKVHFWREKKYLHYRPSKDAKIL